MYKKKNKVCKWLHTLFKQNLPVLYNYSIWLKTISTLGGDFTFSGVIYLIKI